MVNATGPIIRAAAARRAERQTTGTRVAGRPIENIIARARTRRADTNAAEYAYDY